MSQQSFFHVPHAGFAAFAATLSTGPWAFVDTSAYEAQSGISWTAPSMVLVKLRLKHSVQSLLVAISGARNAKGCDRTWDACQKQLCTLLEAAAASTVPAKREAAKRLQQLLLLGAGEGQTKLRYQEEVDLGRIQLQLVAHGQAEADVELLGLDPVLAEIAAATDDLAMAIGHGVSAVAPHVRRASAIADCVATFTWAAETLEWMTSRGVNGPEKDLAVMLLASLTDLASRYPLSVPSRQIEVPPASVH